MIIPFIEGTIKHFKKPNYITLANGSENRGYCKFLTLIVQGIILNMFLAKKLQKAWECS